MEEGKLGLGELTSFFHVPRNALAEITLAWAQRAKVGRRTVLHSGRRMVLHSGVS